MTEQREALDLRLVPTALACWGAAALAVGWSPGWSVAAALMLWCAGLLCHRRHGPISGSRIAAALALLAAGAAMAVAGLRAGAVQAGPLRSLASQGASAYLSGRVATDPVRKTGQFAPYAVLRMTVDRVTVHGVHVSVRSPVLVIGDERWLDVAYGASVEAFGRLETSDGPDLAAVLIASGPPTVIAGPGWVERQVSRVRTGLREAAAPLSPTPRALLPALVDGDLSAMPDQATADFRTTGLTHLLAVSGSNLTLVLGFVLFVARLAGVRGYALLVVGALAVVAFVLLARPQPSVLRAAAMGVVGLAGLSSGSAARGVRVLSVAVIVLVLLDPWLARSTGFVLSTLATTGIVLLGPRWRTLLASWLPVTLAEAISVPLAAQLVCTPVIAAISGQVSVVAVLANLAAAPAVGPATVTSLLAGLTATVSVTAGRLLGRLAGIPLSWIAGVADHGGRMPGASVDWPSGGMSVIALTVVCAALVVALPWILPRRVPCLLACAIVIVLLVHPPGRIGWPPTGWVLVMCDVGQGDGLVLNAGDGAAVVVDTGPDPVAMAACLRRLHVTTIPLVVLTHFHADHVDGLSGVLAGWPVGRIETSPYDEPVDRYRTVVGLARHHHVPLAVTAPGTRQRVGTVSWQVLGPPSATAAGVGDGGSGPNNASVILLVHAGGIAILLAGDAEPEEEDAILATHQRLAVDVLKEPHHGSAAQDPRFLAATHASVSLISVGVDNPYGHPAPQTLAWLHRLGMAVYRTDLDGDLAVTADAGVAAIVTSQ